MNDGHLIDCKDRHIMIQELEKAKKHRALKFDDSLNLTSFSREERHMILG